MIPDVPPETLPEDEQRLLSARFGVVVLATFAYFTALGSLLPTLPRFVETELEGGGLQVGIGVGAFAVSAALLRPLVGRMGDVHGRRILAVTGAAVVGLSIFTYGLVTSLPALVMCRLVTGAGEAAVFVGVATAAQDLAPDNRRGEAASYFSVALYGGLAVGPPLGEAVLRSGNFTTVWLAAGVCSLVAAGLGLGIPRGDTIDEVPHRRFLQPDALGPGVILFLGLIPFIAFASFLPLYADEVGLHDVGPVLGVYAGLVLMIRIVGARLPDQLGWRRGSTLALCGVGAGSLLVGVWGAQVAVWIAAVLIGLGMSLLYPTLFTAVMGAAPESERSHAVGTFSVFFDLSSGFGASIIGAIVSLTNERGGFVAAGLCAGLGLAAQFSLRHRIGVRNTEPLMVADE